MVMSELIQYTATRLRWMLDEKDATIKAVEVTFSDGSRALIQVNKSSSKDGLLMALAPGQFSDDQRAFTTDS